jgi:poly(A) polymerase/tRNA nucleotidyltransferase (CCA-adding enzyme)
MTKFSIPPEVSRVTTALEKAGFSAYLVGGCVRDLVLGREPKDWDVATSANPTQISALFPKTFYENAFGTVTVVNEETPVESLKQVEVTPFRLEGKYSDQRHPDEVKFTDSLEEDLARRDFTINALAYSPTQNQLVDPFGGQADLKNKLIRAVGEPSARFEEDALRLMRAVRLAAQLGFTLNSETAESIAQKANLITKIAVERVRDEFVKLIESPNPMVGLVIMQKLFLLKHILPEIEEGLHVKQNGDHKYDVWEHSLRVLQHAADKNYSLEVRLAALFHDIGKPRTREWSKEKNDYTFYGHDVVGARMVAKIMERLKFGNKTTETVIKLVRNHMFFSDIEKITLSAVRRIIVNVGPDNIWKLMEVRMCDRIGMGRPKESPYRLRKYQSMIEEALRQPTSVAMLKMNGGDVLRETGLTPGPKIGFILHALLEEVLEKPELNTADYLSQKAKELAQLDEQTLKKLGESGKEKKEAEEEKELSKIREKFHVK